MKCTVHAADIPDMRYNNFVAKPEEKQKSLRLLSAQERLWSLQLVR
jgi:hypothetical protein